MGLYRLEDKERAATNPWKFMVLLYAAPTSKPKVPYSTGAFEKMLIREFARVDGCINRRGAGGECPSNGSPHFCYVIVREKIM